ncbi:hypothetical protein TNCV_3938261 [Trichonephila clavipes]|nr:hypothetical protein TNCV_3938261 [Trichonephila clavipes]
MLINSEEEINFGVLLNALKSALLKFRACYVSGHTSKQHQSFWRRTTQFATIVKGRRTPPELVPSLQATTQEENLKTTDLERISS